MQKLDILLDPEDMWLLDECAWSLHSLGYAYNSHRGIWLHHCIIGYPIWEGDEVDHINRIKLDNRRCNLRYVSRSQNQLNRDFSINAKHIYMNGNGYYFIQIKRAGHKWYRGTFETMSEAQAALSVLMEEVNAISQ